MCFQLTKAVLCFTGSEKDWYDEWRFTKWWHQWEWIWILGISQMVKLIQWYPASVLETGELFGNTIISVKFHSWAVIHWTPLFLEIWAPAFTFPYPLLPGSLKTLLLPRSCASASALSMKRCSCLSSCTFPVCVHSTLPWGRYSGQQGLTPKTHRPNALKQKCSHFLYLQPFL